MGNKKASPAGLLYYTFGTIILLAVITICAINFAKDGRVFQKPALTTAKEYDGNSTEANGKTDSENVKTIIYTRQNESKPASESKKNVTELEKKNTDTNDKDKTQVPANPGENP